MKARVAQVFECGAVLVLFTSNFGASAATLRRLRGTPRTRAVPIEHWTQLMELFHAVENIL